MVEHIPRALRPNHAALRQQRQPSTAAAKSEEGSSRKTDDDSSYQLRRDLESVTRTVLEGKALLEQDRAAVKEEEAKERFFGRIAVLSLGVSCAEAPHALTCAQSSWCRQS